MHDLKEVYYDTINQMCKLEKQVLENKINIARLTDGSLTHLIGFGPRVTFVRVSGEVAHIIRCPVVTVELRSSSKCYGAIPVTKNGSAEFLMPITRVLSPHASEIHCSAIVPFMFTHAGHWILSSPEYRYVNPPRQLQPQITPTVNLSDIRGFSEGGIYSTKDLQDFYQALGQEPQREAQLTHIAAGMVINANGEIDIPASITEDGWKKILKRNLDHLWGWFVGVGEIMSGVLALYVIGSAIRFVISWIVRAFSLYQLMGCTWKLAASLFSSTTQYFANKMNSIRIYPEKNFVTIHFYKGDDDTEEDNTPEQGV